MDDEAVTATFRRVLTTQMVHGFMIDQMLTLGLFHLEKPKRLQWAEMVLKASIQTEQLAGLAKGNELMAANLSEMVIEFQEQVDQVVGKALLLVEKAEEGGAAEFYRKRQNRDRNG